MDISAPSGTPIYATASGKVVFSGWEGGYGKVIKIKHKYRFLSLYAHCGRLYIKKGDYIKKGALIAAVGLCGCSTGPHCHYEIRKGEDGKPINPYPFMNKFDDRVESKITLLHYAIDRNCYNLADYLLKTNRAVMTKDIYGISSLELANILKREKILQLIKEYSKKE